mmetsp:Transcript_4668/g.5386  ORF Transcript_4668/g.5386 Transcript_4668/m.5386 type:complete len:240 (-) Transcript_4668:692-1411(-)
MLVSFSIHFGKSAPTGFPSRDGTTLIKLSSISLASFLACDIKFEALSALISLIHPYIFWGSTVWYNSISYHSTLSAKIAPAELILSGICITPLLLNMSLASIFANGEFVAPTQYFTPSGKFSATSSVIANELAHGTKKSHDVDAQSSIGVHPSIFVESLNKSHVCTQAAPSCTSSFATTLPTFPHPCTVKVRWLISLLPSTVSTAPRMLPITEDAVATFVSTLELRPASTYLSPVASTR